MLGYSDNVLVVIGSGPGIGNHTAGLFAEHRFNKVALLARNTNRLLQDKEAVEEAGKVTNRRVEVKTWSVDVSDTTKLKQILGEVQQFGQIEIVFFNAARVIPSEFFGHPESEIRVDFEITIMALYAVAGWAWAPLKYLAAKDPETHPSIIVTNSHLWNEPAAEIFALSLTKAAQHNMVRSLAQLGQKDGIHVALLSPCGVVSPEHPTRNPKNIASKAWDLYLETRNHWKIDSRIL
ncbi:NAD(P)-binding protein [Microthyrium microscopicum]|uniref:NAD(P)-binding protein n=1 Tax=Microthyrium microscopicum TaxID=703497 RepID=A0A6A6U520_9PEZI|nr:NAD(P)-binding protein [Microthyrium microscopicum]